MTRKDRGPDHGAVVHSIFHRRQIYPPLRSEWKGLSLVSAIELEAFQNDCRLLLAVEACPRSKPAPDVSEREEGTRDGLLRTPE